MKDQFVKRFESLSEDFIYYMRSVEHLKDNTVQNYISWLKFLSESYPIDEKNDHSGSGWAREIPIGFNILLERMFYNQLYRNRFVGSFSHKALEVFY